MTISISVTFSALKAALLKRRPKRWTATARLNGKALMTGQPFVISMPPPLSGYSVWTEEFSDEFGSDTPPVYTCWSAEFTKEFA